MNQVKKHQDDGYAKAIPARLLVSLEILSSSPHLTTKLASLKTLLLQANNLRTLHYAGRGQGTNFQLEGDERLPALTNLYLQSYDWNHSADCVRRHWDFSQIRSLRLVSMPIFEFLDAVEFNDLSNLHTLHVDDFSAHRSDKRIEATRHLSTLIGSHIRALEVLEITCHTQDFSLDAILQHGQTLRELRIRDHVGHGEDYRICPTLRATDLARLADRLPYVQTLELDLDTRGCTDVPGFLKALGRFRTLDALTLNVQTLIEPIEALRLCDDPGYVDLDIAAKTDMLRDLIEVRTNPDRPWRKITINSGGYRLPLFRRLGATWKTLNEHQIYAERCFMLKRVPPGEYIGWEVGQGQLRI